MEKILLIVGFLLLRYFLTAKKDNKKKANSPAPKSSQTTEKPKNIEDIFGDFMKEIKEQNSPQTQAKTVSKPSNRDFHRAEEDSNKKLDWQQVVKAKASKEKKMTFQDYAKVSHSNIKDEPLEVAKIDVATKNVVQIDLKQAILYKEILERKYFTV